MSNEGFIKDWRKEMESDIWLMPPLYYKVWQWIKYTALHTKTSIPNRDGTFTGLNPGQCATSYRIIASGVGYYEGRKWKEPNIKTIKSILDWLVKQKMISVCSNGLGTILTVENWELYQSKPVTGNAQKTIDCDIEKTKPFYGNTERIAKSGVNQRLRRIKFRKGNTKRITVETLEKHFADTKEECNKNDKNDKKSNTVISAAGEKQTKAKGNTLPEGFDLFWAAYPKKVGKKDSIKAWQKVSPDEDMVKEIISGVESWKVSEQWTKDGGQFIPNPTTFLRGERWKDECSPSCRMSAFKNYDDDKDFFS